jgi:hypothetical protein
MRADFNLKRTALVIYSHRTKCMFPAPALTFNEMLHSLQVPARAETEGLTSSFVPISEMKSCKSQSERPQALGTTFGDNQWPL